MPRCRFGGDAPSLNQKCDIYTLQSFICATTIQVHQVWASQEKVEALTGNLSEKAKLHWIGPRQEGSQGRALLYFFGEPWFILINPMFTDLFVTTTRRGRLLASTTRTFSFFCSPSTMPYQLRSPWATSASPFWSIVSSLALSGLPRRNCWKERVTR